MSALTLTVDATAKPVSVIPVEEAVSHIATAFKNGKHRCQALLSDESRLFRSQHLTIPAPVILMWTDYVEVPAEDTQRVSRRALFARDGWACQYCDFIATPGRAFRELTVDHVKPVRLHRSRAEATTWDNVVTACKPCNTRKGGFLPREVGMMPRCTPKPPHFVQLRFAGRLTDAQRDYVADYFKTDRHGLHF
jgi:5-methylcytosine-specific restriction endonuclease McrA